MTSLQPRPKTSEFLLVFLFFLLLATCLVNLNGGDWDGTQIALGSFFPQAAKASHIRLYNFEWQPLTYAILHLTYRVTGSPEMAMFLPALLGSLGIGILLITMSRLSQNRLPILTLAGIILLVPEFLFGSVYMNSTVFGFPFAALAMWLACPDWTQSETSRNDLIRNFFVGLALALAVLCRFDYLLTYPMFLFLLARRRKGNAWRHVIALGLGSALALLPAFAAGATGVSALFGRVTAHHAVQATSGRFHRTAAEKLAFALVGVNIALWMIAAGTAGFLLVKTIRKRKWFDAMLIAPLAILLYPVLSLVTPKYLVPFYMFFAAFLAWSLAETVSQRLWKHPALTWILGGAVALACFLPARPTARPPFFRPTMNAALSTDDGPRAFFGYAHTLRHQSTRLAPPDWLRTLLAQPQDLLLVPPFDGWLAGSLSQPVLIHLTRNCQDISIGAGMFSGRLAGKRIVLAEPHCVQGTVAEYFAPERKVPSKITIPHGFTPPEVRLLRALSTGDMTEAQLKERVDLDGGAFAKALRRLRWAEVLETSGRGRYRMIYDIQIPESDPNQDRCDATSRAH